MSHKQSLQTLKSKRQGLVDFIKSRGFRVALGAVIVLFFALSTINLSRMSTRGYDISNLQKKIAELEKENQKLDFKVAKSGSMQSIQDRLGQLNLVAADNVEYAILVGSSVARR